MADRKITAMHKEYARAYGYKCADCPWLSKVRGYGKAWFKCAAYQTNKELERMEEQKDDYQQEEVQGRN